MKGYLHTFNIVRADSFMFRIVSPFLRTFCNYFLPISYGKLPHCHRDAPIAKSVKREEDVKERRDEVGEGWPLVLFSHGLTGVGEEHSNMAADWARAGFVVAFVHHCDGSSSRAVNAKGEEMYYEFPPGMRGDTRDYPADFRPKQVLRREEELSEVECEGGFLFIVDNLDSGSNSLLCLFSILQQLLDMRV